MGAGQAPGQGSTVRGEPRQAQNLSCLLKECWGARAPHCEPRAMWFWRGAPLHPSPPAGAGAGPWAIAASGLLPSGFHGLRLKGSAGRRRPGGKEASQVRDYPAGLLPRGCPSARRWLLLRPLPPHSFLFIPCH